MKKLNLLSLLAFVAFVTMSLSMASCSSDDDDDDEPAQAVNTASIIGTWSLEAETTDGDDVRIEVLFDTDGEGYYAWYTYNGLRYALDYEYDFTYSYDAASGAVAVVFEDGSSDTWQVAGLSATQLQLTIGGNTLTFDRIYDDDDDDYNTGGSTVAFSASAITGYWTTTDDDDHDGIMFGSDGYGIFFEHYDRSTGADVEYFSYRVDESSRRIICTFGDEVETITVVSVSSNAMVINWDGETTRLTKYDFSNDIVW